MKRPFRILYFEKDNFLAQRVKMALEWEGLQVAISNNEKYCLSLLRQKAVDLLIYATTAIPQNSLNLLHNIESLKLQIPVILAANEADSMLIIEAFKLGCADYVVKDSAALNYINELMSSVFLIREKKQHPEQMAPFPSEHEKLKRTQCIAKIGYWEYYPEQQSVLCSPALAIFFRLGPETVKISFTHFILGIHAADRNFVKGRINYCLLHHQPVGFDFRWLQEQQPPLYFHINVEPELDDTGNVQRVFGVCQENTEQKKLELRLRRAASFLEITRDAVFITNAQHRIISINPAFSQITGLYSEQVLGKKASILNPKKQNKNYFYGIIVSLLKNNFWQGEILLQNHKGRVFPAWQSISAYKNNAGKIVQTISVFRDISEQKAREASIRYQANYDELTQLPNRGLFLDRLRLAIKQATRNKTMLALMLLDLDKFKWVNDTLGHHAGDIMLKETAIKLQQAVRKSDTIARLGGDEFTIILPELEKSTDAKMIAEKIIASFKTPIVIDNNEVYISGSLGIAVYPEDSQNAESLQIHADHAMYAAKEQGRNCYRYYTAALQRMAEQREKLINEIRCAIENNEFTVHFLPIIDASSQTICRAEALLRWQKSDTEIIPASEFIPLAEETGLIRPLGIQVVQEVAKALHRWSKLGLQPIDIFLNKSLAQFSLPDCDSQWLKILEQEQVSPQQITIEITENVFFADVAEYNQCLTNLKHKGIQIALDSFGSGQSSICYLKKHPVDFIKIDRALTHGLFDDPDNALLIETIITLANKLGIRVIAAGVENKQQMEFLKPQCNLLQGFYFSKPLSRQDFENILNP